VRTNCRVLLVYDDTTLSASVLARLVRAYGSENTIPISDIVASARATSISAATSPVGKRRKHNSGRRLFHNIQQTVPKLWIWALPAERYPRLAYMDLDVLVTANIDDLLSYEFDSPALAVSCPRSAWYRGTRPRFNAGVLVLKPSMATHAELLRLSRFTRFPWWGYIPRPRLVRHAETNRMMQWYDVCAPDDGCRQIQCLEAVRLFPNTTDALRQCRVAYKGEYDARLEKACAVKIGDQALHNHVLKNKLPGLSWENWTPLGPLGINVDSRALTNLSGARLIHFLGEPKPWEASARARHQSNVAAREYRSICASTDEGDPRPDRTIRRTAHV
jgi:hypothetical protein